MLEKNGFWDGNNLIVQEKNVDDLPEESQQELSQASNIVDYLIGHQWEEHIKMMNGEITDVRMNFDPTELM